VTIEYAEGKIKIQVDRVYRDEEARIEMEATTAITVRLIGANLNSIYDRVAAVRNQGLRTTEYENEFEVDIPLSTSTFLTGIDFSISSYALTLQ
jgi:molybdenum cofactor biosynthesis enzyme